jgi:uncharacterized NAD-dependent epimerase/dehydratase family protein
VEGQGSLFHPSFSGVSLGLLHGTQPDAFVVCHEPTRTTMRNVANPVPGIDAVIELTQRLGAMVNDAVRCVGLAVNTSALTDTRARDLLAVTQRQVSLPACDPLRYGCASIVDLLAEIP